MEKIVERRIDGVTIYYYALQLTLDDVILFVPVDTSDEIGLRRICTAPQARALLDGLPALARDADQGWNRRYRENMLRIRSGDIEEVAKVVKNLIARQSERGLSTGEKKMLDSAKRILISELALALRREPAEIEHSLDTQLCL